MASEFKDAFVSHTEGTTEILLLDFPLSESFDNELIDFRFAFITENTTLDDYEVSLVVVKDDSNENMVKNILDRNVVNLVWTNEDVSNEDVSNERALEWIDEKMDLLPSYIDSIYSHLNDKLPILR